MKKRYISKRKPRPFRRVPPIRRRGDNRGVWLQLGNAAMTAGVGYGVARLLRAIASAIEGDRV